MSELVNVGDPAREFLCLRGEVFYYHRKFKESGRKGAVKHSLKTRDRAQANELYDERYGSHAAPLPTGKRVSCQTAFEAWSLNPLGVRDENTVDKHRTTRKTWCGKLHPVPVADVTPKMVIAVLDRARTVKSEKTGKLLSPAMQRQVYVTMSAFFKWTASEPQVYRRDNPVSFIGDDYRPDQPESNEVNNEQLISREEVERIVDKIGEVLGDKANICKHEFIAEFSPAIGTRISETLAITLENIELPLVPAGKTSEEVGLPPGRVTIEAQLRRRKRKGEIQDVEERIKFLDPLDPRTWRKALKGKKGTVGDARRVVTLNPYAERVLRAYLERGMSGGWLREERNRQGLLLPSRDGTPMIPGHVGTSISLAAKKAGISRRIVSHYFRHTFASQLRKGGRDFTDIADQLGNSPEMARKRYVHVAADVAREKELAAAGWQ